MAMETCTQGEGTKYRVLVVDDHPLARDALSSVLQSKSRLLGISSICEVASGEEAVALSRSLKPHAILMDIGLPGIDGFEASRRIKEEMPEVSIVMVTAIETPGQREMASQVGAIGFVTKDRVMKELLPLLEQVLYR